jgi:hypothetical protein
MRWTIALILVAACASGPQWHKEGATKEATEADTYLCDKMAAQGAPAPRVQGPSGTPSGLGGERKAAFNAAAEREGDRMQKDQKAMAECMRAKGYSDQKPAGY